MVAHFTSVTIFIHYCLWTTETVKTISNYNFFLFAKSSDISWFVSQMWQWSTKDWAEDKFHYILSKITVTPSKKFHNCIICNEYILIEKKTTIKNKLLIMFQLRKKGFKLCTKMDWFHVQRCITSKATLALCSLFREHKTETPGFQQHRKKSIKEDTIFAHPVFLFLVMFKYHVF